MRIVAGVLRGRRLQTPRGMQIRPTSDRVREAIFNIIGEAVSGTHVLDLFAGTGALGLEALSRGASRVVSVDESLASVELIQANIKVCNVAELVRVIHASVNQAIHRLDAERESFDLIFMDPPYGEGLIQKTLVNLAGVARSGALVVAEHDSKDLLPHNLREWIRTEKRKYGDTAVSFYLREIAC